MLAVVFAVVTTRTVMAAIITEVVTIPTITIYDIAATIQETKARMVPTSDTTISKTKITA